MRNRECIQEYGDYIEGLASWDWFGTVGFSKKQTPERAMTKVSEFLSKVQDEAEMGIGWVIVGGHGESHGRFHCHFLVAYVDHLSLSDCAVRVNQRFGNVKMTKYNDPSVAEDWMPTGAAYYMARHVVDGGLIRIGGDLLDSVKKHGPFHSQRGGVGDAGKDTGGSW